MSENKTSNEMIVDIEDKTTFFLCIKDVMRGSRITLSYDTEKDFIEAQNRYQKDTDYQIVSCRCVQMNVTVFNENDIVKLAQKYHTAEKLVKELQPGTKIRFLSGNDKNRIFTLKSNLTLCARSEGCYRAESESGTEVYIFPSELIKYGYCIESSP